MIVLAFSEIKTNMSIKAFLFAILISFSLETFSNCLSFISLIF